MVIFGTPRNGFCKIECQSSGTPDPRVSEFLPVSEIIGIWSGTGRNSGTPKNRVIFLTLRQAGTLKNPMIFLTLRHSGEAAGSVKNVTSQVQVAHNKLGLFCQEWKNENPQGWLGPKMPDCNQIFSILELCNHFKILSNFQKLALDFHCIIRIIEDIYKSQTGKELRIMECLTIEDIQELHFRKGGGYFLSAIRKSAKPRYLPQVYQGNGRVLFVQSSLSFRDGLRYYQVMEFYPVSGTIVSALAESTTSKYLAKKSAKKLTQEAC